MSHTSRVLSVSTAIVLVVGLCLVTSDAQAQRLNLTQMPPDVYSALILVQYDSATDLLTAAGSAGTLDLDGGETADFNILDGTFAISATIDETGAMGSGTLAIGGTIPELGATNGWLLTGTLSLFGYPTTSGAETLDFLFDVTGGDLASRYGSGVAGVWLHDTGFEGTFAASFDNDEYDMGFGEGSADAFAPEPSTAALLLGAVAALLFWRRRGA